MADTLHFSLEKFRNTILSAVAQLEFELRHNMPQCGPSSCCEMKHEDVHSVSSYSKHNEARIYPEEDQYELLARKLGFLETTMTQVLAQMHTPLRTAEPILEVEHPVEDLLNVKPVQNSRNIVISSVKNTPALSAAVASVMAMPPTMSLDTAEESSIDEEEEHEVEEEDEEEEVEEEEVEEEEVEEEEVEEEEVEEEEVEEEEVEEEEVEEEEEEVVEEEEEGIEVEEFEYKGITYQRDDDNNVYLDGEQIGTWNGKRILPLPA